MVDMEYHSFLLSCRHVSAVVSAWKKAANFSYQFHCSSRSLILGQLTRNLLSVRLGLIHLLLHRRLPLYSLEYSYFRLSSHSHRKVFWSWKLRTRSTTCCIDDDCNYHLSTHNITTTTQNSTKNRWTLVRNGGAFCMVPSGWDTKDFTINFSYVMFSLFSDDAYHLPRTALWCAGAGCPESMWPIKTN